MSAICYAHFSNAQASNLVYADSSSSFHRFEVPNIKPPVRVETAPAVVDNTPQYNAELNGIIAGWVQAQPKTNQWGVAVKGLANTNLEASSGGDTVFETASVFKLYLVYALSQRIPEDQWATTMVDDKRSLADCVKAMLERSDNACGIAVGNKLGWSKAQANVRTGGYTHTNLNGMPITSTPNDTLKFLDDLYNARNVTPQLRDEMLGYMRSSIYRQGIVAGCPDCVVANKTGNLDGVTHDVAIIQVDGKDFTLSIYSKGGTQKQIAALTTIIQQYVRSH